MVSMEVEVYATPPDIEVSILTSQKEHSYSSLPYRGLEESTPSLGIRWSQAKQEHLRNFFSLNGGLELDIPFS